MEKRDIEIIQIWLIGVDKVNGREQNLDRRTDRVEYFDLLRIIATFAVVLIHVTAWFELHNPPTGVDLYLLCGDLFRWAVPIFVMISGALLLGSNRTIKQIYAKSILRIVTTFLFWSIIYAFVNNGRNAISFSILGTILDGPGHLWFLYMIIGLYMIIPILNKVIESDRIARYFLFLSLLFVFLVPYLIRIYSIVTGREASIISAKIDTLNMYLPLGYSGYFVLGYYLRKHDLNRILEIVIYSLAVLGVGLTAFSSIYNDGDSIFRQMVRLEYLAPIVLIESTALFIFFKKHTKILRERTRKVLANISKCTFGVYLIHILVMNFLFDIVGVTSIMGSSIISVLVISLATFLISLLISELLNAIPFINKYIV